MDRKIKGIPLGFIVVVLLSLIPLVSLLPAGLPITHDGQDHVARIANFYTSLSEGTLIPRWAGNLNWGYGHPILMFLYPLPSYIASFFHFLGFNLTDSVKLVFAFGFIGSGISMYFWARNQFNEYSGIAISILYLYAPYRFVDLYVRGAIGEHVAFVFLPMMLYFSFKFFNQKKFSNINFILLSSSNALLLLSHNALSIMFLPVEILYISYLFHRKKDVKKLLQSFISLFMGFMLSVFFIIPAFFEGKYTLRDIVTGNEYFTRFINPQSLIWGQWSFGGTGQFSTQIGVIHILGVFVSLYLIYKLIKNKNKSERLFLILVFLIFLISVFLTLSQSNFLYSAFTVLKKFQFPWRFLSLTVFASSVLAGSVFMIIKDPKWKKIILVFGILAITLTSYEKWQAKGYLVKSDTFYNSIYQGTTDTGESSPIWSIRFMEHFPKANLEIISGQADIKKKARLSTRHDYEIDVTTEKARFRENTLYFPGWEIISDQKPVGIEFQDEANRGLMTFYLDRGVHNVTVVFKDTKLRSLSNAISLISLAALIIVLFYHYNNEPNKKK